MLYICDMYPFGETVLAWRLARGMTQAELARASRLPRPNLSAIERGEREVTLRTLRALALALGVRPGVLADGTPPGGEAAPLSRAGLERVARAAARGAATTGPREATLARQMKRAAATRLAVAGGRGGRARAAGERAYFLLRTMEKPEALASLLDRMALDVARR